MVVVAVGAVDVAGADDGRRAGRGNGAYLLHDLVPAVLVEVVVAVGAVDVAGADDGRRVVESCTK